MGGATPRRGEFTDLVVVDMDGMREPDIVAQPAQGLHPVDRAELEALERVAFLVEGLAEMGVKPDLVVPRHRRRLLEQRGGDGEGRAGRQHDLRHRAYGRVVILPAHPPTPPAHPPPLLDATPRPPAA